MDSPERLEASHELDVIARKAVVPYEKPSFSLCNEVNLVG
jgi:hypothetical protein